MVRAVVGASGIAWNRRDVASIVALLVIAIALRIAFFTGFFGSDEVTYTSAAYRVLTGSWPAGDYIGEMRYGVNLPVAVFMRWFGVNQIAANMWALLTSVGEVGLVFAFGRLLWNVRAGFLAGLVLALLPLHVHFAGRLMADSPLAFFMTLSCVLFFAGETTQRRGWYLASGLAAGAVFWIKQPAIIYLALFAAYALVLRRWSGNWIVMAVGVTAMLALNSLLMLGVTGDAWHLFRMGESSVAHFVDTGTEDTSPGYYFRYLLLDVRHTWLLAFLAIWGAVILLRDPAPREAKPGNTFVLLWAAVLIGIFSLFPVSLHPIKLIFKQTNYMLMFAAPLALLSGVALSRLKGGSFILVIAILVVGSVTLSGLEQQSIRVFTANSKAAVNYADTLDASSIYATTNNVRAEMFANLMRDKGADPGRFKELAELQNVAKADAVVDRPSFAVVDLETIDWSNRGSPIRSLADVPPCWQRLSQLEPADPGLGQYVADGLLAMALHAPASMRDRAVGTLRRLAKPQPAIVYKIHPGCGA
jgi:4-amino-4-deoxy-L-arabinose transferase-like glycosyltransferase